MVFRGGVHPRYNKITADKRIEKANLPKQVILPLSQHVGAPCKAIVNVGDEVKTGQLVAESDAYVSAKIHASISGVIKSIEDTSHPITGKPVQSIIIEGDDRDTQVEMLKREYENFSVKELIDIIRENGIVGLGGAAFPAHVKFSPPKDKKITTLIVNGAECEPFLTTDHRLMVEKPDLLIAGIRILKKILHVKEVYIGIENNKKDAIRILQDKCEGQNIRIKALPTKYPQGGEKNLIYAITKKKVPTGGLPMDVGCVVTNVGTSIAVYEAVALNQPLFERVVTVTGRVKQPKNLLVRNGTIMKALIEQCGGYEGEPLMLINGGPMMGFSMPNDELPVIKGTSGLVVFNKKDVTDKRRIECIRCGKCVDNCPMDLHPSLIALYAEKDIMEKFENLHGMDCYECGCCAFDCPSNIPLVQMIRYGKSQVLKRK